MAREAIQLLANHSHAFCEAHYHWIFALQLSYLVILRSWPKHVYADVQPVNYSQQLCEVIP